MMMLQIFGCNREDLGFLEKFPRQHITAVKLTAFSTFSCKLEIATQKEKKKKKKISENCVRKIKAENPLLGSALLSRIFSVASLKVGQSFVLNASLKPDFRTRINQSGSPPATFTHKRKSTSTQPASLLTISSRILFASTTTALLNTYFH